MPDPGGGGGALFETVTVTPDDVLVFPAASRATAVSVCDPSGTAAVFQLMEYGEAVSWAPRFVPSSLNCTPATALLSLAVAVTVIVPETVAPEAGLVIATVGGLVSPGGTEYVTRRKGRSVAVGCSVLAKKRYRSRSLDASDLSRSPKLLAGVEPPFLTLVRVVPGLLARRLFI